MSRVKAPLQAGFSNHVPVLTLMKTKDKPLTAAQITKMLQADVLGWSSDDTGSLLSLCKKQGYTISVPCSGGRNNRAHAWSISQAGLGFLEGEAAKAVPPLAAAKAFMDTQVMLAQFLYLTPPPVRGGL